MKPFDIVATSYIHCKQLTISKDLVSHEISFPSQFRAYHVTWRRPQGGYQLMGGSKSKKTSEVVTSSGTKKGFDLKHKTT